MQYVSILQIRELVSFLLSWLPSLVYTIPRYLHVSTTVVFRLLLSRDNDLCFWREIIPPVFLVLVFNPV